MNVYGSSKSFGFAKFLFIYNSLWSVDHDEKHFDGENGLEYHGELMQVFKVFNKARYGYICTSELQWILESLGMKEGRDISICENMIIKVEINFDRKVYF